MVRPFALDLARNLVVASVYDRETQIRRAASAAFQENVGRMVCVHIVQEKEDADNELQGLFPHGIDVLRKIDFFAVSGRRDAFLTSAPHVAE